MSTNNTNITNGGGLGFLPEDYTPTGGATSAATATSPARSTAESRTARLLPPVMMPTTMRTETRTSSGSVDSAASVASVTSVTLFVQAPPSLTTSTTVTTVDVPVTVPVSGSGSGSGSDARLVSAPSTPSVLIPRASRRANAASRRPVVVERLVMMAMVPRNENATLPRRVRF